MPQIQVIDREDPAKSGYNNFMEQLRQQQETVSNVMYKKAQVEYQKELAKLEARKADSDEAKFKAEQDAKDWEIAGAIMSQAEKASKQSGGNYDTERWNKLTSQWALEAPPGVGKKLAMLAQAGPQAQADPKEAYQQASTDLLNRMAQSNSGSSPAQPNRASALSGMIPKGISVGKEGASVDFVNPEAENAVTAARNRATQETSAETGINLVNGLEKAWNDSFAHHRQRGMVNPIQATTDFMGAASQKNMKVNEYIATAKATLSMIVRALGEKGTLTNQDIARVQAAIPTLWDSKELAKAKLERLRDIIRGVPDGTTSPDEEFTIKVK